MSGQKILEKLIEAIDATKDVDGFTYDNIGKLFVGDETGLFPCTVEEGTIIERNILSSLRKSYKYIPKVKFPGYKECLDLYAKDDILEKLKQILSETYHRSDVVGKILELEYGKK